jgi:hypothetical protein
MGYPLLPTQTRIPIPRPPLLVDRFPSFIVIASPSVIVTTLTWLRRDRSTIFRSVQDSNSPLACRSGMRRYRPCGHRSTPIGPDCCVQRLTGPIRLAFPAKAVPYYFPNHPEGVETAILGEIGINSHGAPSLHNERRAKKYVCLRI